ncbi:carbohydrate ABC transporter permease [Priestia flexa]|uniref:Carbohydrate ABC transporter permease n=1 Tax=Priestia flexa TaxID=86664 RepID=A0A8I1MJK7_9BACI|nr:carbohydrate ABC transporter permease [Priestia flexa]MBN8253510.1 carbohydrate ABC transporter permease [Priestia flexa]MBN8435607.1 carbohydrate ABC transporter permease [Priestia flexa]MCA0968165.1 carbohydrate ABC transporter permease [Priestia flexa]UIR30513.1 carbohydrate ABC transporter permease [Priestia flexa]
MSKTRKFITYTLLIISTFIIVFPILYAFSISFMTGAQVLEGKILPTSFTFDNYRAAFERVPLLHYLLNSFIVSISVMFGQIIVSSLAAFAFVFISFKGREALFFLFISTMMIPWEATMVPNFLTVQKLGWLNSHLSLTIPFFALAFGTFLLRQQFKTIPHELYEASQVAGISRFRFFWNVVLPVSKTSLVTLGVYSFLTTWNMYLWPLLVTNTEEARTVQIGLKQMQTQEISTDWGVVMAAVVVVILPTLLLLFLGQKRLQKGLTQGAIK